MVGMFNLRVIFELVNDAFDNGPLAQQVRIHKGQQPVFHVASQHSDQLQVELLE